LQFIDPQGGIQMAELIKVSAQSRSTAVAGAIAGVMREHGYAEIQAIGASAINQAIKAVTIARGYLQATAGIDHPCDRLEWGRPSSSGLDDR
jgi:stage V sporulation protein S